MEDEGFIDITFSVGDHVSLNRVGLEGAVGTRSTRTNGVVIESEDRPHRRIRVRWPNGEIYRYPVGHLEPCLDKRGEFDVALDKLLDETHQAGYDAGLEVNNEGTYESGYQQALEDISEAIRKLKEGRK